MPWCPIFFKLKKEWFLIIVYSSIIRPFKKKECQWQKRLLYSRHPSISRNCVCGPMWGPFCTVKTHTTQKTNPARYEKINDAAPHFTKAVPHLSRLESWEKAKTSSYSIKCTVRMLGRIRRDAHTHTREERERVGWIYKGRQGSRPKHTHEQHTRTHIHTNSTHARTHARTHAHTHEQHTQEKYILKARNWRRDR